MTLNSKSCIGFVRHMFIQPWLILNIKVKVVRISTSIILEMVQDVANKHIAVRYEDACKGFRSAHWHLTLTNTQRSKSRSSIFSQPISWKYWKVWQTLILPLNRKSCIGFRLVYLHLTMMHSKGRCHGRDQCLGNGERRQTLPFSV